MDPQIALVTSRPSDEPQMLKVCENRRLERVGHACLRQDMSSMALSDDTGSRTFTPSAASMRR
jgi:hypothetical protein